MIKYPIPRSADKNSATKTPVRANVDEVLRAGKTKGRELGNLNLKRICHLLAENDFSNSNLFSSIAFRPLTVLIKRGKKQNRITIIILGIMPMPKNNTIKGIITRIGVILKAKI